MPGTTEIIIVVVIILLLFGAKKLPELARGLGKSITEFKKGVKETDQQVKPEEKDKDKKDLAGQIHYSYMRLNFVRKIVQVAILLFPSFLFISPSLQALDRDVGIVAEVDRDSVTIGDEISYWLGIRGESRRDLVYS